MPITWETYERVALEDENPGWELDDGVLRVKPATSWGHNNAVSDLGFQLARQLDRADYRIRTNGGRVRCSNRRHHLTCYVPDVFVVPTAMTLPLRARPDALEVYDDPLPLVIEVWDPPTFEYDTDLKVRAYLAHGDREVWRLHPFEHALTVWRSQHDGSYQDVIYRGGIVPVASLPGVGIDLDEIFED